KAEEIIGKHCSDDILVHITEEGHKCCDNNDLCPLLKVLNTRNSYEGDFYFKHRDGYRVLVHIKSFPVFDNNQNIIGVREIFYDNSEINGLNSRIKELEQLALLDTLTRIGNRRYIEIQLRSRLNEYNRFGWQFGFLFIDIDHFKKINDHFGHNVGDRVLKMVANVLIKNCRSFDLAGRWGGEEFIVIVPHINDNQLYTIAHKFKHLIAFSSLKIDSNIINVTVSIGATLSQPKDTLKSIIKRTDRLMYESKKMGVTGCLQILKLPDS
ncbi:MAG: sensor domain-containing diguanylate cyclase, partial [bacterium]